jgi:hypothetical protein
MKRIFKTNSKFLVPILMMSTAFAMSYSQTPTPERIIDLSAFKNLSSNIKLISNSEEVSAIHINDNLVTQNIIKTIDKEIGNKIVLMKKISVHRQKLEVISKKQNEIVETKITSMNDEINNNELIQLYEIKSDSKSYIKFENEIADEVRVADSSTLKSGPIEPADSDEELTMFDYSSENSKSAVDTHQDRQKEKLYDRALSPAVKETISRYIGKNPIKPVEKIELASLDEENGQVIYDYTPKPKIKAKVSMKKELGFASFKNKSYTIEASEIDLDTSKPQKKISTFNFNPDYNREERVNSLDNGKAELQFNLNEGVNTQSGIIEAEGMLTTRVELSLSTQDKITVPMISEDQAEKLYSGKNLILLALSDIISDVEIDGGYSDKVFFNEDFKKVDTQKTASYILFGGVKNGNVLIKYFLNSKETAQKVIYVGEKEMYFEAADFSESERQLYSFTTRNLMSAKETELSISPELVKAFNTNIVSKKRTLNTYELKMPAMVSGTRRYIEMKHLNDSIFIGIDKKLEIDVPSNEFISKVLEVNEVSSLRDHCVVQINLSKELKEFTINGKNKSGEMYTETTFLDDSGKFSKTDSEQVEKIFVVGDMEGMFGAKLEYSDDSIQFLKTYCSEGSYIIEQL